MLEARLLAANRTNDRYARSLAIFQTRLKGEKDYCMEWAKDAEKAGDPVRAARHRNRADQLQAILDDAEKALVE